MPPIRSINEEEIAQDAFTGIQREGGFGGAEGKTLADFAQQFDVHPHQIAVWRGQRWMARPRFLDSKASAAEPDLAGGLGVSRTVVREALRALSGSESSISEMAAARGWARSIKRRSVSCSTMPCTPTRPQSSRFTTSVEQ